MVAKRAAVNEVAFGPNDGPQSAAFASTADVTVYGGGAGGGKRLRLDEPIPTPSGWTAMGSLRVGDAVLGADGQPVEVVWCSEVEENPDAWELEFDDGTTIQCDADHQWVTLTDDERDAHARLTEGYRATRRASRPRRVGGKKSAKFTAAISARNARLAKPKVAPPPARGNVRTTSEIVATLRVGKAGRSNHCVLNPEPLDLPRAALPIDPYTLGAWLGDGTSSCGDITGLDPEVWETVELAGYTVLHSARNRLRHCVKGLVGQLRSLGVLRNKHIPAEYLRASAAQRIELLRGLCDTDGHACEDGGVEFTTTSAALRDGFMELLATLGIKPSCCAGRAMLRGRDISAKWRIGFFTSISCFRIGRKTSRQKTAGFRGVHDRRYIVDARKVPPVPMRCIAVASESRTYLASRRMVVTHNTHVALQRFAYHADRYPGYAGIIFRREMPMVTVGGGLWEEAMGMFPIFGAKPNSGNYSWRFRRRSMVQFRGLQLAVDVIGYQGAQLAEFCFEEATHFLESQFWYLFSRLRTKCGMKARCLLTCNPDPDSWVRKLVDWWIGPEGFPLQERAGKKRYFFRDGNALVWGNTPDEVRELLPHVDWSAADAEGNLENKPGSMRFIPALLKDNPKGDPGYAARLSQLPLVERERLKGGNWNIRNAAGNVFKREWYEIVDSVPGDILKKGRYWDLAATEPNPDNKDPDWTRGVKMSRHKSGLFLIHDVASLRGRAFAVDNLVQATAQQDGKDWTQGFWQDPGQAGKSEAERYRRELAGYPVKIHRASKDKITNAKAASSQAEGRNVKLLRGPWNDAFLAEHEAFPDFGHDDIVDGESLGMIDLTTGIQDRGPAITIPSSRGSSRGM